MTIPAEGQGAQRAGFDPRAMVLWFIGSLLSGLGRFSIRFANPLGALSILGVVVAALALAALRPVHAWDQIAYLGAAWRDLYPEPADLHARVYEAVRLGVTPEEFAALSEGDTYRLRQSTDPLAFQSMLGMYAVKWLYVKSISLLAPSTGALGAALAVNIGAAAVFAGVLLWWLRAVEMLNLGPTVVALLLLCGFPAMAMAETPDLLASAFILAAFLFLDRGMAAAGVAALVLGVLTRPDQAASAGVLMAFFWLMRDRQAPALAAGFAASVVAYVFTSHGSGHPGWWPHLWFSTYQIQVTMEFFEPAFSLAVYVQAFAWNLVRAAFENAWLGLYLALIILWAVLHAGGLRFSDRRTALIGAALTAIAAKFILFPLHDGRTVFPLLFPALLLMLASARDAARKSAGQALQDFTS
ncbi:MAG: hypothetical protein IPL47_11860 [Phyllobacteriaceae bacterium]|nr:hypothetical protein [Phyllobacteriaceae bacterium]